MEIKLSDHFNYKRIMKFTLPSVIMMVFTSVYGVVDGFFISNFVGKTPFAAVNLIIPFLMMVGAIGFMFGAGGSALIAKTMGEGDFKRANGLFSMIVYITLGAGTLLTVISYIYIEPVARFLGAEGKLFSDCVLYARINLISMPLFILQFEFQSFFITAEKPKLGLYMSIACGITNMLLDALLMAVLKWGVAGASLATAISQMLGGIIPLVYFGRPNKSLLKLGKPVFDLKALIKTCTNGSSELLSNISMSLVSMLYNIQLIKYAGENGVAAYGVLMYVNFTFVSIFIGFSIGIAPVISYHFGAKHINELKSILRKSLTIISASALLMLFAALLFAYPLSYIFVGYDKVLMDMTLNGFYIFSFSFLFAGFAIYSSSFFTALNDGVTSAIISFLRTLVFQSVLVLILPVFWKINGIWISVVGAELMAVVISVIFLIAKRKKYNY